MPLDPAFVETQRDQFRRELVDTANIYVPVESSNEEGELVYSWPAIDFTVPCIFLGGGGSAQERQIAAKVEAPIIASLLIGPYEAATEIKAKYRVTIILQGETSSPSTTEGPFEVLAPPVPKAYGVSYRVVLGSV